MVLYSCGTSFCCSIQCSVPHTDFNKSQATFPVVRRKHRHQSLHIPIKPDIYPQISNIIAYHSAAYTKKGISVTTNSNLRPQHKMAWFENIPTRVWAKKINLNARTSSTAATGVVDTSYYQPTYWPDIGILFDNDQIDWHGSNSDALPFVFLLIESKSGVLKQYSPTIF